MPFERIRDLRIDADLTQQNIADLLHVEQHTYSRYETGALRYSLETIITLARFYNTSVDYLLGLTDEKRHIREPSTLHKTPQKNDE
ncbi:MAG: helix-turn-helix domain-containing protein [Oscillospiraceae bacterium]|nr:helix-turn-helix domain-containing protein [Oscillospiraceae bacterium]